MKFYPGEEKAHDTLTLKFLTFNTVFTPISQHSILNSPTIGLYLVKRIKFATHNLRQKQIMFKNFFFATSGVKLENQTFSRCLVSSLNTFFFNCFY